MVDIVRYWRTDSTAGAANPGVDDTTTGDNRAYPTLAAAVTGEAADLVSAGDTLTLRCTTPATVDTAKVIVSGYTLGVSNTLTIECTGDAHHSGVSRSNGGTGYQLLSADASNPAMSVRDEYVNFKGIEIGNSANQEAIEIDTGSTEVSLDQCIFIQTSATTNTKEIVNHKTGNLTMKNCLVISNGNRLMNCVPGTNTIDHCGFIGGGDLGILADASTTFTNCYAVGSTDPEDFWNGSGNPLGNNNASLDGTAQTIFGAANSKDLVSLAAEFTSGSIDPTAADMTLLAAGTGQLVGAGTGTEGFDITGAARSAAPRDIGPYELAAAGGGIIPQAMYHYRNNSGSGL